LGTGRETSVKAVVDLMRQVVGETRFPPIRHAPERPGEVRRNFVDMARAGEELDFHPTTDLLSGLQQTWQWFEENPAGPGDPEGQRDS